MTEDQPESLPPPPSKTWLERAQALLEVLLVSGLVSSLLASLPFVLAGREAGMLADLRLLVLYILLEAALTGILLAVILRAHGETLRDFGLAFHRWRPDVMLGLAIIPVLFLINALTSWIFMEFFPQHFQPHNPLTDLVHTVRDLAMFIGTALIAGGVKEEVQRSFILRRFQSHLGGAYLGLLLWSLAFGMGHSVQGPQAVVAASLFGLIFGIAYLSRGSLLVPMVAHGAYDAIALMGYWLVSSAK
jgi:membrane protease YdiL (CAAX protease family)